MSDVVVNDRVTIPAAELGESFARSGGPGGQHVNKTESKVELRWSPADSSALTEAERALVLAALGGRLTSTGDFVVTSERTRDQSRNRDDARRKLAGHVRAALVPPVPRKQTRPSKGARKRRLDSKTRRGSLKRLRRKPNNSE